MFPANFDRNPTFPLKDPSDMVLPLPSNVYEATADAVSGTATVCTLIQFLVAALSCRKQIIKEDSSAAAAEASPLPYISGLLSCTIWLVYSMQIEEAAMILVNTAGYISVVHIILYFFKSVWPGKIWRLFSIWPANFWHLLIVTIKFG
jgi:hypothetical protein